MPWLAPVTSAVAGCGWPVITHSVLRVPSTIQARRREARADRGAPACARWRRSLGCGSRRWPSHVAECGGRRRGKYPEATTYRDLVRRSSNPVDIGALELAAGPRRSPPQERGGVAV